MKHKTALGVGVVACCVLAAGLFAGLPAQASPSSATAGKFKPGYVYQGTLTSQNVVLGPQSDPTVVVQTPPLPAGTYLVTATVPAVISGNDQIVCATVPASLGISTNDGVFGTAGNGSPGAIYGTASITDTWRVMTTGDRIDLVCNSFNYGQGTYTGSDSITALATKGITRTNS